MKTEMIAPVCLFALSMLFSAPTKCHAQMYTLHSPTAFSAGKPEATYTVPVGTTTALVTCSTVSTFSCKNNTDDTRHAGIMCTVVIDFYDRINPNFNVIPEGFWQHTEYPEIASLDTWTCPGQPITVTTSGQVARGAYHCKGNASISELKTGDSDSKDVDIDVTVN